MPAPALELSERYRLAVGAGPGHALSAELPAEVAERLPACLPGWVCTRRRAADDAAELTVEAADGGWLVRHALLPGGRFAADTPLEAANAAAGAATGSWIAGRRGWVQLHAAAVLLNGSLTLLLGPSGAGKSTLALEYAAAGHRLFGDDRLAIELGASGAEAGTEAGAQGIALGVGPKLRLPLPTAASPALRRLAEQCAVWTGGSVAFLTLPEAGLAQPGARAAVGRLVLLERGAAAGLGPVEAPAVLRALLPNALAPRLGPAELLAWTRRLAEGLPCLRLGYRDAAEARRLLEEGS